ncbi:MAG: hypothetical protein ABMB14_12085 [Myxococcota bacterium]
MVLHGERVDLDGYLRRAARAVQLLIAVPATIALWYAGWWWWVPIPLVASIGVYEALFWARGDRPTTLRLGPDGLSLDDPLRRQQLALRWDEVELATATWQRARGGSEVVVLLADRRGPRFAVRFLLPGGPALVPGPNDVDLDAADAILGGQAGVIRSVAPFEVIARQRFEHPVGFDYVRAALPPAVWRRTGLRVWTGAAPPLDLFGYHVEDPDGWLVLDGTDWTLRRYGADEVLATGDLTDLRAHQAARTVSIVVRLGTAPIDIEVPLIGLSLGAGVPAPPLEAGGGPAGPVRVWLPAPTGAKFADNRAIEATDRHTHPPEGAALVWHLLRTVTAGELPAAVRTAISAAGIDPSRLPAPPTGGGSTPSLP